MTEPITVEVLLDGPLTVEVLTTGPITVDAYTDGPITVDVEVTQAAQVSVEVLDSGVMTVEVDTPEPTIVVEVGVPGLPGPRGPSGDATTIQLTAQGAVSALRVIVAEGGIGRYANPAVTSDAGRVIGVAVTAAVDGAVFNVQSTGPLSDVSWSFVPGPIFCGGDGVLTQSPPAGWVLEVARAVTTTSIVIGVQTPLIRS